MKNLNLNTTIRLPILALAFLVAPLMVSGQDANQKSNPPFTGKYEGSVKGPDGDVHMTLDLVDDAGKFSGSATAPQGVHKVVKGELAAGLLTLEFDDKAKLTLRQKGDTLVGELSVGGKTGAVELKRVAKDEISGVWDASADAQGQPVPFTLTLKLDGEKVTGGSSSQLGESTISSGSWKDGKLAVVLEGGNGQVALVATMVDGKLTGDFDYAGQMQGKWVGIKRKP